MKDRAAVVALVAVVLLLLTAALAEIIAPYDPTRQDIANALAAPSAAHWLGTDGFGRDELSRIVHGSRVSLALGFISVGISLALGVPLGLAAGFYGGKLESVILRVMDVMLAFPGILLTLVVVAVLGTGLVNAMVAVGIAGVPQLVRVVRASTLSVKGEDYVLAARSTGCTGARVMAFHVLPNASSAVIVIAALRMGSALLIGATLSYLGLGAQPPAPEWGAMLAEATIYVRQAWWLGAFPGLAITITVLAINVVGDGLRDALDPRLRSSGR